MTIEKHIAALRALISKHEEDESPYSDEALYHLFTVAAATLMRRKYDKYKAYNDFNMRYFCVGMEKAMVHECNCVSVGCNVMRSKNTIPTPIMGRDKPYLRIMTLDHQDIPHVHASAANALNLDRMREGKLHYSIVNGKVVLWNSRPSRGIPAAILVAGFFEDPSEWSGIQLCDSDGNDTGEVCFDIYSDSYPVDQDLVDAAYSMVLDKLRIPLSKGEDRINEGS